MVSGQTLNLIRQSLGILLGTHHYTERGIIDLERCYLFVIAPCGKESSLVKEVLKIRARKSYCRQGNFPETDLG